jgi:uncharacterized protein (TIGR03083 family)
MTQAAGTPIEEFIAGERRELAALLAALPGADWDKPSLCAGWRVREVVAHMTMPFRYSTLRFATALARARLDFAKMADRCARRDAAAPPAELVAALRDNERYPWKPPGAGLEGALTHDVIHGLDITTALGTGRRVPQDRLRQVLATVTGSESRKHFGVDLTGIELRATDLDWSFGTGAPLAGEAQDLALVLCGRQLPAGHLSGEAAARFSAGQGPPRLTASGTA